MGKCIRVLHLVSRLSYNTGVMNVLINYYRHIDHSCVQFDFVYFLDSDESLVKEVESTGGRIYCIPKPSHNLKVQQRIKEFMDKIGSDYVAFHNNEVYLSFFFAPLARKAGILHFITHSHSSKLSDIWYKAIRNKILSLPARWVSDYCFACLPEAGRVVFSKHANLRIINNAIDANLYAYSDGKREEYRKQLNIRENHFVVGHVGRFYPVKNHRFLLAVFSNVLKLDQNAVLVLVGNGLLMDQTVETSKKVGIYDNIRFLGSRTDVNNILSALDAFILPSLFEGMPMSLMEAQANGLKCYASDTISIEANVGLCRFLPVNSQPELWANTIINNKKTSTYERELGSQLVKDAGFDITTEAKKLQYFYMGLLQ